MRRKQLAALVLVGAAFAFLPATMNHTAHADSAGTPMNVGAFNCSVAHNGHVEVPAGSTIVIRQAIAEQTFGILQNFLGAQTTITSVNDALMGDASNLWSAPFQTPEGFWETILLEPTGVTLANPGDTMRFTFALLLSAKVPEIFNPAAGGAPGQPVSNGPGLVFGGTCTVTAT